MGCVLSSSTEPANTVVTRDCTPQPSSYPQPPPPQPQSYPSSQEPINVHRSAAATKDASNAATAAPHSNGYHHIASDGGAPANKLESGSGSEEHNSTATDTTQPHHLPNTPGPHSKHEGNAKQHPLPDKAMPSAPQPYPAADATPPPNASRLSTSLRDRPFATTPTRQSLPFTNTSLENTLCQASPSTNPRLLPQYAQQLAMPPRRSSISNSGMLHVTRESMLSDISATFSAYSTAAASSDEFGTPNNPNGLGGRVSVANGLFRNGDDLEAQRQQAPLSIEEDLFIYDDIVISKDEARTKHWRLAGRKPPAAIDAEGGGGGGGSSGGGNGGRSNSLTSKNVFSFNDFDVCVDELDLMPVTGGAASGRSTLQHDLVPDPNHTKLKTMTSTNTVAARPNTVAHHLSIARAKESKVNRPLRHFDSTPVLGHATRVKCIALSPAELDFASCSNEDASITINNLNVRAEVGIFTGHQDTIINATFSPDGKYLATTSKDKTMILWDVVTTKNLLTFAHPKVVICCCFGSDSKYLVSGCQDRICRLWDTRRGKEWLSYTGHDGIIISIAFSPDGNYVCSASADKSLRVWSATTAKTRFHLTGHLGIILSCSYTSDGKHIISNDESYLRVWSAEDGSCKLSLSPADVAGSPHLGARGPKLGWTLSSPAPGAFTGYMLVACNNRFVYVLDIATGKEVTNAFCKAPVYCLTAGSYEKMACGDSFGNIYILTLK